MKKIILLCALILLAACALGESECKHSLSDYKSAGTGSHTGVCSKCGETVTEAHSLEKRVKEATCVSPAQVSYVCIRCGYTTESFLEGEVGTGHNWGNYGIIKEATCTSTGLLERTCTLCGKTETNEIPMTDHDYSSCTSVDDYNHRKTCKDCGATTTERHDHEIARTISYAQDFRLGKKSFTCTGCGYMYTRFYSAENSKLYTAASGDRDGYITVDTYTAGAGGKLTVRVYPDGVFTYTAETDSVLRVYADAASLEYKGLCVVSGSGAIKCAGGNAVFDFIACEDGAALTIDPSNGAVMSNDVCVSKGSNGSCVVTKVQQGRTYIDVYPDPCIKLTASGIEYSGSALLSAVAAYSADARRLSVSVSDTAFDVTVYAGGSAVLQGSGESSYDTPVSVNAMEAGWYVTLTGRNTYTSAILDAECRPVEAAAQDAGTQDAGEQDVSDSADEPEDEEEIPGIVDLGMSFEYTVRETPDIRVVLDSGMLRVEVSNVPSEWKYDHIKIVQTYTDGGFKLINSYTETAEYALNPWNGTLSSFVYFRDSAGGAVSYKACGFAVKVN